MSKELLYGAEAREKMLKGLTKLATAVATTLGPRGRTVIIDRKFGAPLITKDGVTVAKEIFLPDPFENMGAQIIREAATKTNDTAGDGTTTATVLAYSLASEGAKMVASGHDPMEIKKGIDLGIQKAMECVQQLKKEVKHKEDIFNVASISANSDTIIGSHIADAIEHVGKDGVVTVEESRTMETYVDYVEGMQYDKGYLSPYFSTSEDLTVTYNDPIILLYDKTISNVQSLRYILEMAQRIDKPLLIIAENVEGDALTMLVLNHLKGILRVCAVKAPGFGDRQKEMLEDIAILTGGTVISEDVGLTLGDVKPETLGRCGQVKVTARNTTIVDGIGDPEAVKARIALLHTQIAEATSDYEKEKLQERLAKLSGGVAVINVGAATEVEMKEKKHRVEDALSTARAAIEEGIVPGGGVALITAASAVQRFRDQNKLTSGEVTGLNIVIRALEEPMRKIASNAGYSSDVVIERAKMEKQETGFNAAKGTWVNMFEEGIIDPTKVTLSALRYAGSVASMLLTTECAIVEIPEKEEPIPPPPM